MFNLKCYTFVTHAEVKVHCNLAATAGFMCTAFKDAEMLVIHVIYQYHLRNVKTGM